MQLVGILPWDFELGRIAIFQETLLISNYQADTRVVHSEVLYHIFSYLKSHTKMGRIGYYSMGPNVDLLVFNDNADWV